MGGGGGRAKHKSDSGKRKSREKNSSNSGKTHPFHHFSNGPSLREVGLLDNNNLIFILRKIHVNIWSNAHKGGWTCLKFTRRQRRDPYFFRNATQI